MRRLYALTAIGLLALGCSSRNPIEEKLLSSIRVSGNTMTNEGEDPFLVLNSHELRFDKLDPGKSMDLEQGVTVFLMDTNCEPPRERLEVDPASPSGRLEPDPAPSSERLQPNPVQCEIVQPPHTLAVLEEGGFLGVRLAPLDERLQREYRVKILPDDAQIEQCGDACKDANGNFLTEEGACSQAACVKCLQQQDPQICTTDRWPPPR